eukprot:Polyplicarium_translucidae@DN1521_c0_g1_i1.p1
MIPCHPAQKYGEEGAHNRVLFVSGFIRHHGRLPFPDAAHRPTPSRSARSSRSPGSGASPSLRRSDLAASSSLPSANFVSKALELLATAVSFRLSTDGSLPVPCTSHREWTRGRRRV